MADALQGGSTMARKATEGRNILAIEQEGIATILRSCFGDLVSLDLSTERNVCRVLKDYIMSRFGVEYFEKLNLLVGKRNLRSVKNQSDNLSQWIDHDLMDRFDEICDTDVFDNPKSLSTLADMIFALRSSLNGMTEDDIAEEADYLFDVPYRFSEMVRESTRLPRFYSQSLKYEEADWSIRERISLSSGRLTVSYTKDLRK
jgi:hypothetical protein